MYLLTWPFWGLVSIFEEVIRQAEEALYDEAALQHELRSLYARLEAGQVSNDEFEQREGELAERLALAEDYHRRRGHAQ